MSTREILHRREVIHAALEAVLSEQDDHDVHEADVLADAYLMHTRTSQTEALERARCQAQDVKLFDMFQW